MGSSVQLFISSCRFDGTLDFLGLGMPPQDSDRSREGSKSCFMPSLRMILFNSLSVFGFGWDFKKVLASCFKNWVSILLYLGLFRISESITLCAGVPWP